MLVSFLTQITTTAISRFGSKHNLKVIFAVRHESLSSACDACLNAVMAIMKLLSFWCPWSPELAFENQDTRVAENILLAVRLLLQTVAAIFLDGVFSSQLNLFTVFATFKECIHSIRMPSLRRSLVSLSSASSIDNTLLQSYNSGKYVDCGVLRLSNSSQDLYDLWFLLQDEVIQFIQYLMVR
jgi:hypothetical protein